MLYKLKVDVLTRIFGFEMEIQTREEEKDPIIEVPIRENAEQDETSGKNEPARNAMCPCGSGKRYKHCHGALQIRYKVSLPEEEAGESETKKEAQAGIMPPTSNSNEDPAKVLHDYIKEQRQQVLTGKWDDDDEKSE